MMSGTRKEFSLTRAVMRRCGRAKADSHQLPFMRVNRRAFIKTGFSAAVATAFPDIIPSSALGRDGNVAASERIGMGFIGLGGRGRSTMPSFLGKGSECIAVCDVWKDRREAVRQQIGGQCAAYGDLRELLARPDIDAVSVATPEHWHVLACCMAARAGKDVYCEKSVGPTVAEGRVLSDTMRRYARVFQFGTQQRSDGNFRFACELVRNGRIGALHTITISVPGGGRGTLHPQPVPKDLDYDMWLGPAPWIPYVGQAAGDCWVDLPDYAPGFISTWGVHHVDIAQWGNNTELTGPVTIEGRGEYSRGEYYNLALRWQAECTYANGVKLIHTDESKNPNGVRFEGTDGWVFVTRGGIDANPKSLLQSRIRPEEINLYRSDNHAVNFLECVRTRRETISPAEVAHRSTTISLLCDLAMRLGRKLKWDPVNECFPEDPAANRWLTRALREPWSW